MTYPVVLNNKTVGSVSVERQGLYYCFHCNCRLPDEGVYTIWVSCGDHREKLGICIPSAAGFTLDTKIPSKRFPEDKMIFSAALKNAQSNAELIPVFSEEPFLHLDKLEGASFTLQSGQPGILLSIKDCHPTEEDFGYP